MRAESARRVVSITDPQIRFAIANRRLIRFKYGSSTRIAEPHDYGVQQGVVRLLVFQRKAAAFLRGWRMLEVGKISELQVLDDTFAGSRCASHTHHFEWDELFARVN